MSLAPVPLTPVCVRDPRTIVDSQKYYAVLKGGSQYTLKQYSTTAISQSQLQFACVPPSGSTFIDRKVKVYVPVRLTFTGIPALGDTLIRAGRDAPRAFPLSSSLETLSAYINQRQVDIQLSDIVHALMRYNTGDDVKNGSYSTDPVYADMSQSYGDLAGTSKNCLGSYGDSGEGDIVGRGAFPFIIVQNPIGDGVTIQTVIVDCAFCESLYVSPFWWGVGVSNNAFYNVTSMDFTLTFTPQSANRMWSHDSSAGGAPFLTSNWAPGGLLNGPTSFGTSTGNAPAMLIQYIDPQETQMLSPQMSLNYPYYQVQKYITDQANLAAGASTTMLSNNIQLGSIPRRLYIFVQERLQDKFASAESTDTFMQIQNCSLQFQNKNGLLSSANMLQLYEISSKNGCNMDWEQWSGGPTRRPGSPFSNINDYIGTVGSVLVLELGTDVGLNSIQAAGVLATSQLQVQLTVRNVANRAINPSLYIVVINEGVFTTMHLASSTAGIGVLAPEDVLKCHEEKGISYSSIEGGVKGGDFFSGLKDIGKWLSDTHVISDTLGKIPGLSVFAPALKAVTGFGAPTGYGVMAGGRKYTKKSRGGRYDEDEYGGVAAGGEMLDRSALAKRIAY